MNKQLRRPLVASAWIAAAAAVASTGFGLSSLAAAQIPVEAPMFRTIEVVRKKTRGKPKPLPRWYGRHPCPPDKVRLDQNIPGGTQNSTKREARLRGMLKRGEKDREEFDKTIQVFAQRARQEVRYLSMQRREYIRRAKRWAGEMVLQGLEPSTKSLKMLLLGCSSTGDTESVQHWFKFMKKRGHKMGRFEYNAVIGAHGNEGYPHEASMWMERMRAAGFAPDARTYASLVDAWERIGNRQRMLQVMREYQDAEEAGELGEPLDPRDVALPYYALARTYAKAADAPRAVSVLKVLQAKGIPMTREVHRLRLEAHLKMPGRQRSIPEIERALRDLLATRPEAGPLYQSRFSTLCRNVLGDNRYEEILHEFRTSDKDLVPALPTAEEKILWRRANVQAALWKYTPGRGVITRHREDQKFMRWRKFQRRTSRMGQIEGGYRVAGEKGLPEWMTIPDIEKFG